MAQIDQLVEELERSYREAQERMSDPAVYNDHRQAAEAGRRLKELEAPQRLAKDRSSSLPLAPSVRAPDERQSSIRLRIHCRSSSGK